MATDQQIFDRYFSWLLGASAWSTEVEILFPDFEFGLDHAVLYLAAKSYWNDIDRFKSFHLPDNSQRADALKKAAFSLYWISRFKPISVRPKAGYGNPDAVAASAGRDPSGIANCGYAFAMIWPYLGYRYGAKLQSHLIYLLMFWVFSAETLLSLMTMLDEARVAADSFAVSPQAP